MARVLALSALANMRNAVDLATPESLRIAAAWSLVYLAESKATEVGVLLRDLREAYEDEEDDQLAE